MQSLVIKKQDWTRTFDGLTKGRQRQRVTIQVLGQEVGAQDEVVNVEFDGLSFDPKGDALAIMAGPVEHMIKDPASIELAFDAKGIHSLRIADKEDLVHLVEFQRPLDLQDFPLAGR